MPNKTLIFIPTYNEGENIDAIIRQILALNLDVDLLFIDDNSPDGTGLKLDHLASMHANLFVQHRPGKLGIGSAHIVGIKGTLYSRTNTLPELNIIQLINLPNNGLLYLSS